MASNRSFNSNNILSILRKDPDEIYIPLLERDDNMSEQALKTFLECMHNFQLNDELIMSLMTLSLTSKTLRDLVNANNPVSPFNRIPTSSLLNQSTALLSALHDDYILNAETARKIAKRSPRYQAFKKKASIAMCISVALLLSLEASGLIALAVLGKTPGSDLFQHENLYTTVYHGRYQYKLSSSDYEEDMAEREIGGRVVFTILYFFLAALPVYGLGIFANSKINANFLIKLTNQIANNHLDEIVVNHNKTTLQQLQGQHRLQPNETNKNDCLTLFANAKHLKQKQDKCDEILGAAPQRVANIV